MRPARGRVTRLHPENPGDPASPDAELHPDPLAPNYTDEELELRRLSPQERRRRAKEERTSHRRAEKQVAHQRLAADRQLHQRRAAAERDFALHAREDIPLAPEIVKAKKKQPILKIMTRLGMIALVFGGIALGVASLTSPKFNIADVEAQGMRLTSAERVDSIILPLVGQNVVRAKAASVEAALEKLPTVADAQVTRLFSWPPKVTVKIVERQDFVKVGAGNQWWVVDASGMPFRTTSVDADFDLYSVTSPKLEPKLGKHLPGKDWSRVNELITALKSDGKASGAPWTLRRVYFDKHGAAALRMQSETPGGPHDELLIRLGEERWSAKLKRARETLAYFDRTDRKAEYLDLVSYERPLWRPKPEVKPVSGEDESEDASQA